MAFLEFCQWFFDGFGTEILGLIVGAAIGGFAGYKIGIKKKNKQKQIAKNNSTQHQEMNFGDEPYEKDNVTVKYSNKQTQKAGKNSEQVQIGGKRSGE